MNDGLFDAVIGQRRAVEQLKAAARQPVHAYLFVGPPGSGKRVAALAFAAALLCPEGGCGECRTCRRVRSGAHLDVIVAERTGPYVTVLQAQDIVRAASRSPAEGARKVMVLVDLHLLDRAAPVLLKTIEEPAPGVFFVILAEYIPPDLETIASRCVRIDFDRLSEEVIVGALEAAGVDADVAMDAARSSGGRLDRARLLAGDPGVGARRAAWAAVPTRLDGTGATAVIVAGELLALSSAAGEESLRARHAAEVAEADERAELTGERPTARKELDERHRREQRRLRLDELRFGLSTLEAAYRDRAAAGGRSARAALDAAAHVQAAVQSLVRNPSESLLLEALMVRLSAA